MAALQNMDRILSYADEITPLTNTKWTVLVRVIECRNAKRKTNGPMYKNYVVTNTRGIKVPIVVFDGNVAQFGNTLMSFRRYYVSDADVKENPAPYRVFECPYTWILYHKKLVEPYPETIPPPLPCQFAFAEFSDFYRFADQERSIYMNVYARYKVPTLIVAYNLKVTTEHGLSLKTKTGAYILENPPK